MDPTLTTESIRDISIEILSNCARIGLTNANKAHLESASHIEPNQLSAILQSCAQKMQDQSGRFRLWAADIGATQIQQASLEARLAKAQNIITNIAECLSDLRAATNALMQILSGERPARITSRIQHDDDELSDISDSASETSRTRPPTDMERNEIDILVDRVSDTITNLMQISIAIRRISRRDQYAKSELVLSRYPFPTEFDLRRILDLFPKLRDAKWLAERLGRAVVRRRQHFKYREDHHERMLAQLDFTGDDTQSESSKASTFGLGDVSNPGYSDHVSESGRSNTTFGSLHDDRRNAIPRMPKTLQDGEPGECPFCFKIVSISTQRSWIKHIYDDLHPYVCVFPACDVPSFASRQLWFDHELVEHILVRACVFCRTTIRGRKEMLRHIQSKHQALFVESQRTAVVESCEEVRGQQVDCPLCYEFSNVSQSEDARVHRKTGYQQLRSHLGRHLQYIALDALPSLASEGSGGEADTSIHGASGNSTSDGDEKLEAQESELDTAQWGGKLAGPLRSEAEQIKGFQKKKESLVHAGHSIFEADEQARNDDAATAPTWLHRPRLREAHVWEIPEVQKGFYRSELEREGADLWEEQKAALTKFRADEAARKEREKRDLEDWLLKQAKEDKDTKDKADAEYRRRTAKEMRAAGYREEEIEAVLNRSRDKHGSATATAAGDSNLLPLVYPRVKRVHVSEETLRYYRYRWEVDRSNRDYIIILHELSHSQVDELYRDTRRRQKG